MSDLDVAQLEALTPHVTTQLQAFNHQVVAHLKNYKPEIGRIYERLGELTATDERLEGQLKTLESDVIRNNDQALSNHNLLAERLAKVEQLLAALPSWKEDLLGRIDNLTRETRAKHDAAASRTTVLEDTLNGHIQATRERLDMLTTVARTASEARAQQQERIDEMDTDLRRLREFSEREFNDHKMRLRRHDEQHVMASSKMAEQGGMLSGHKIELARLKDASDQHNRQLENLARGMDKLHDVSSGLGQEVNLMKRGMAAADTALATLEAKLLSSDGEAQSRLGTLEEHRNALFTFRDETHAAIERIDKSHELMTDRVQMLDAKVDAGPPGLWKMASQVAAHEDELASTRIGLAAAKATNEELTRRLEDLTASLSHQRDMASQLREECRLLADRLTAEAARNQQYVDDRMESTARRYEVEALRKSLESGLERLEASLAGSGERLKFELLHDEAAQVGSIREYMASVEKRNAQLQERMLTLETALAGEAERGRSVAAVTRDLRGTMEGLLSNSQTDLARLRATMSSLHEEYEEMSKKARRAGLLTVTQVEDLIDMRMNGPVLESIIARKLSQMSSSGGIAALIKAGPPAVAPAAAPGSPVPANPGVALSFGRLTSGALRPGAVAPSWQPSSVQRQLSPTPGGGGLVTSESGGVVGHSESIAGGDVSASASGAYIPTSVGGGLGTESGGGPGMLATMSSNSDVALGLRLVTVESDMARLFESLQSLSKRIAPVSEVADLRQQVADLTATVTHVKSSQGILGDAGEEAVRRHVHATLLPEMLKRQSQEARRLMGWMDEQLGELSREVTALRSAHERLSTRLGEVATSAGVAGTGDVIISASTAADAATAAAAAAGRLASDTPARQRPSPLRPQSASAALPSSAGLYGGSDAADLAAKVHQLAEHLSYLSDTLGVSLEREPGSSARKAPSTANSAGGSATTPTIGGSISTAPGDSSGVQEDAAAKALEPLTLNLPSMIQRVQQLEAAVHSIAAGQQAIAAAAAGIITTHPATAAAGTDGQRPLGALQPRGAASGAMARPPPPLATAAAVQGLVDAAVAELKLRLKLLEHEVPLLARGFEVKALKRLLQDVGMPMGGGGGLVGFDTRPALGLGSVSALPLAPGGKVRANGNGRGTGLAGPADLGKRLAALELALATMDERGRALEERWSGMEARWGASAAGAAGDLPRLQATVAQLAAEVQRLSSPGAGRMSWLRNGPGEAGSSSSLGGAQQGPGRGASGNIAATGTGNYTVVVPPSSSSMAEVVNVELAGIAHDLAVAAHEELQRVRDGPLPDGTQDGLPTPVATANREAALARLRRKPLEVAAHVELLESVKLHLDRLMRRATACTSDRLVLLAAMSAMRIKLLENEAEAFREQIIAVFRSLERAFQALVKLQEAVSSKGSASAVGQLANMLQDVSAGLATLAAHAAMRDAAPMSARGAAAAVVAATAAVEHATRRRQGSVGDAGSAGAVLGVSNPVSASGGLPSGSSSPGALSGNAGAGGPLDEALQLLTHPAVRVASPTAVIRPNSPVRLAGPGVNTAVHRQQAAAARGAGSSGSGGGGGGVGRHSSSTGMPGPHQSWPGSKVSSSPVITPITANPNGAPSPSLIHKTTSGPLPAGNPSRNVPPLSIATSSPTVSVGGAEGAAGMPSDPSSPHSGPAGPGAAAVPGRLWSAMRPGSAVVNGLHVGVPPGGPPGPASPGQGSSGRHAGGSGQVGSSGLPSIGVSGLGPGRTSGNRM